MALVQRVSELVQGADQRIDSVVHVARGDARVALAQRLAERVGRDIDAPAVVIDAQAAQRAEHGGLLCVERHLQLREQVRPRR